MTQQTVKPESVSGTRDLLPEDAIVSRTLTARVQTVCESFGFVPIDTPCLERWGVLTGNDPDFNKSLFRTKIVRGAEDKDVNEAELASADSTLRFDLTVPLARIISAYPDLPRPFKRYQTGKVFRGERPQAGRFREFTQFDFDIIGSTSIAADVEIIQMMYTIMRALGVPNFVIRFNTRKVLNGIAEIVDCKDKAKEFFRIIDKADKIGIEGITADLQRLPVNAFDENALALSDAQIAIVQRFLALRGLGTTETLEKLSALIEESSNPVAKTGLDELRTMSELLQNLAIPQEFWAIDLSVARGLDYYTGPVFETVLPDMPKLGSVLSGGRFDGLTNRFMPGSNIAGVGASVGLDRMIIALQTLKLLPPAKTLTQVLVTIFNPELKSASMVLAQELREAGINTEIYLGDDSMLRAQISYAKAQEIPFVMVLGPEEHEKGLVQLKNMAARQQELVKRSDCVTVVKSVLS
ncbi:MAG: histidine--tRNA ligase [Candidatus Andersenbacteria bacterium RIFCSPHIGHO2_12_FULL_45_11]|uniref:Histidine--tRNA ligase n=1 Tax=Candidatus Andersenbacteria bacterium RIFCSPHIGHO2_12_FULL_45_11 TaxID=1797281 RepID=A0A1G1X3G4_9BACT|nr:MAG: histidine--tRNA ligase [Candidatus Andersenbacteria bacterium RIFCSPHIGHO2_12_FULL_45_11]